MKLEGVIFDLDGTLVDSEPIWQQAKIGVFEELGVHITADDCKKTAGLPSFETINLWYARVQNPKYDIAQLTQELNNRVLKLLTEESELKEGVVEVLDFWKSKKLPLGLASASSMEHITTLLKRFHIDTYFELIYSGDFERFGKPHPGIYMSACKKLKVNPVYSVAFEDSFTGLLSAKSARMKAVALLDSNQINETKYDFADLKIESLINFGAAEFTYLESIL